MAPFKIRHLEKFVSVFVFLALFSHYGFFSKTKDFSKKDLHHYSKYRN